MADKSAEGASPKAGSPKAGSPKAGSPKAASPKTQPTTPKAASPRSPKSPEVPINVGVIEADPDATGEYDDDADSALSFRGMSDTTSVASSIFKFREENGRTYHSYRASEAAYFLPNDDRENERLDLQHNLFLLSQQNQLFLCPAGKDKPIGRALDAGTGTGIWAVEFADENPETAVVGIDLSPIQPTFVPPNVEFFIDDLESDWTFVNPFDLIYMRMMTGSIRDWPKIIGQAYQNLNPGGWLELADALPLACDDGSLPENSALAQWYKYFLEAGDKLGASTRSATKYKQQLIDAGFQNVEQVEYKWPINMWPKDPKYKELGAWTLNNIEAGLQGISLMLFTNVLGWSATALEAFLVDVRKDLKNRNYHAYWPIYVVYGQKPEE